MFFAPPYTYTPCGLYSAGHIVLLIVTLCLIGGRLYLSRHMDADACRKTVRVITALLWVLELAKILFVLFATKSRNPNDFVPLYFCSMILYAGLFSSLGRGMWRRIGDVYIATGGLCGGICYLFCPNTSLPRYPMFHFISFHSFILHGLMVYIGLLFLIKGVCRLCMRDLRYYVGLVSALCVTAIGFNFVWDATHPAAPVANLMFMSKDFPGTPVHLLYRLTGPLFPVFMWLIQAFLPFLGIYGIVVLYRRTRAKREMQSKI